jgi:hypothetical protein
MKIKKLCGSLAVTISTIGLCATVSAGEYFDCPPGDVEDRRGATVDEIIDMATALRCNGDFSTEANLGLWPNSDPIWQWKNKPAMGCTVHGKLARLLYEKRTGSPPKRNKHGSNDATGAASDLAKATAEKDDSARARLDEFIQSVWNATENPDHDNDAADFAASASEAIDCINSLQL